MAKMKRHVNPSVPATAMEGSADCGGHGLSSKWTVSGVPLAETPISFELPGTIPPQEVVFGCSEAMQAVRKSVEKVASTDVPVLIQGESGTGKEVVARLIHRISPLGKEPFVKISCPTIPGGLLESELFGYEKGAFTGAYGSKAGWVERAHGGTLFLDEIAELDFSLQSKLLQFLQDGQFARIGGEENKRVDVRLICATNRSLQQEVETGGFRRDLFYRLNVVMLELPPLRERPEDIPTLVDYFLRLYNNGHNSEAAELSGPLMQLLMQHDWPGNIRELENLIKRYVILGSEEAVSNALLSREQTYADPEMQTEDSVSLKTLTRQAVRDLERRIILRTLHANNWNRRAAARALKISYRALFYKIKEAGMPCKRNGARPRPQSEMRSGADLRKDNGR